MTARSKAKPKVLPRDRLRDLPTKAVIWTFFGIPLGVVAAIAITALWVREKGHNLRLTKSRKNQRRESAEAE